MHVDPVSVTVVVGGFVAAVAATSPALDPLVLVAAVTALGTVAVSVINGRMTRQSANIAALQTEADKAKESAADAVHRAEVAEARADKLAAELDVLRRELGHMSNQLATQTTWAMNQVAWSKNVAEQMRQNGLTPPPIPE